jgi:hypothetical protein
MYVSERDLGLAEQGAGPIVVNETRVPKPAASVSSRGDAAEARVEVERAAPAAPHEPPRRSKYEEAVSAQAEGGIFQPLLPERIERAPVRRVVAKADHGLRTTAAVSGGREEASAGLMKAPVPGNDEPASSAKTSEWSFQPLIVRNKQASIIESAGAPRPAVTRREESAVALLPRAEERRPTRQNGVVERAQVVRSNDIQIHIGRIEVTAVPPPVAAPAPAPVRKTQTLEEYLSGGNGRTR